MGGGVDVDVDVKADGARSAHDEQLRLRYLDNSPWAAAGEGRASRCGRSSGHIDDSRIEIEVEIGTGGFGGFAEHKKICVTCITTPTTPPVLFVCFNQ